MSQVSALQDQTGSTNLSNQSGSDAHQSPSNDAAAGSAASLAPQVSQSRKRTVRKAIDSLAVMPLVNESKDPNMNTWGTALFESIINSLSQLPLRVMRAALSVIRTEVSTRKKLEII